MKAQSIHQLAEEAIDVIMEFRQYVEDPDWTGDLRALLENLRELLFTLLATWSLGSRTRKRWLNAKMHNHGDLVFLDASDESSDTRLQLGLTANELYLEMSIARSDRLLQMPDDFWIQWLGLNHIGQFELIEREMFPDSQIRQHPKLFKSSEGTLIPLMRSLLLFPILNKREMEPGALSVSWSFDRYGLNEIFEMGGHAFTRMWHVNRRLVKRK